MKLPKTLSKLIESFERLPGIGPKSAQRLGFYLLNLPQDELDRFASYLSNLKLETKLCSNCKNISEDDLCSVCTDVSRNNKEIIVVSTILDTFAIEKTGFKGVYHVLHGVIDPLNNIGPDEIFIKELIDRLSKFDQIDLQSGIEIILATNSSLEGESTAMYLTKLIRDHGFSTEQVSITRIARGLPVGGDIEYADDITLSRALEGRSNYQTN